jgi:hypothetical protein
MVLLHFQIYPMMPERRATSWTKIKKKREE